jgi:hypothetical protein
VLYPDEKVRKQRAEFKAQRVTFINSKSNYPSLFLAKHNLILDQNELKLA